MNDIEYDIYKNIVLTPYGINTKTSLLKVYNKVVSVHLSNDYILVNVRKNITINGTPSIYL